MELFLALATLALIVGLSLSIDYASIYSPRRILGALWSWLRLRGNQPTELDLKWHLRWYGRWTAYGKHLVERVDDSLRRPKTPTA